MVGFTRPGDDAHARGAVFMCRTCTDVPMSVLQELGPFFRFAIRDGLYLRRWKSFESRSARGVTTLGFCLAYNWFN